MYSKQQLSRYPFFEGVLCEHEMSDVLDSLTGLIARPYIIDFAKWLVKNRIPFTFGMLDLDNFKFINDTYGHKVGDGVLQGVSTALINYLGDIGVAGRFGGDEILFIDLQNISYDEKKHFIEGMYFNYRVLRKNIKLGNCEPFITGTIGCASFPDDAKSYTGLFALIDKTLYRGKSKGRNCYIIYVEEKHKNIEISKLAKNGIYQTFHRLALQFDLLPNIHSKLMAAMETLTEELRITDLYYIGNNGILKSMNNTSVAEDVSDIDDLMVEDMYSTNSPEELEGLCPKLYQVLREREIEAVLIMRVAVDMKGFGYLMCGEPRNQRIWQEDEMAILFFTARMLAGSLERKGQTL
ncbi:MAG: GGDEF domain-containing protein [Lachnospiraceae bacterium]|nr:GGDEF domain-containing protein [Lachnospiraceae bacterium]